MTAEQQARDMLKRMGVDGAQNFSAGELVELANLIAAAQWQPIETAPKDTTILLYGAKRSEMVVGMYHSRDGWVIDTPSEWVSMYPPKHWMPLPAAPHIEAPK